MSAHEQPENSPRPIDYSYWVLPAKLLAGEYPRDLSRSPLPGKAASTHRRRRFGLHRPDRIGHHRRPSETLPAPAKRPGPPAVCHPGFIRPLVPEVDQSGPGLHRHPHRRRQDGERPPLGGRRTHQHHHRLVVGPTLRTQASRAGPACGTVAGKSQVLLGPFAGNGRTGAVRAGMERKRR